MTPHIYQDQYSYITKFHFPRFSKFVAQKSLSDYNQT